MNNKVLLVWSGGCDSSLALLRLLKEGKKVRTISIIHPQVSASLENASARMTIKRKLKEKGYNIEYTSEVTINSSENLHVVQGENCLIQPNLWIGLSSCYLERDEDLAFGYIRTDDFWHFKTEFNQGFKYYMKIRGNESSNLVFPLEWHNKEDVVKELIQEDLLKCCWTCEKPTKDGLSCKYCTPCEHMISVCKNLNIEFPFPSVTDLVTNPCILKEEIIPMTLIKEKTEIDIEKQKKYDIEDMKKEEINVPHEDSMFY